MVLLPKNPLPKDLSYLHTIVTARIAVNSSAMGILWEHSTNTPFSYSLFVETTYELRLPLVLLVDVPRALVDTLAFI